MNPPKIPERISFLIPQKTQDAISEHDRHVQRQVSKLSVMSGQSSTSEILLEKFKACEFDLAASLARLAALQQAVRLGTIDQDEYNDTSEPFLNYQTELLNEKKILSKQRRFIEADLDEELDSNRLKSGEPGIDVLERAYASTMIPRVMGALARQRKSSFRQDRFRKGVLQAYNASKILDGMEIAWCHVIRIWGYDELLFSYLAKSSPYTTSTSHLLNVLTPRTRWSR